LLPLRGRSSASQTPTACGQNQKLLYLLAIVVGSLVTGLLYAALKRPEVVELDAVPAGA